MKAFSLILLLVCALSACDSKQATLQDSSKVIARVGDVYITDKELAYYTKKLTGLDALAQEQKEIRDNVLESLVLSKLMAQKQSTLMNQSEMSALEQDVTAYREERLTQMYLSQQVTPTPPTKEQVHAFYTANLHRFGGGEYANVEYWLLTENCQFKNKSTLKNDQLKKELLAAGCNQSQRVAVELKNTLAATLGVESKLISPNSAFWLSVNKGQSVAFIASIEERKPKPLVEVATSIRKMLAPMQLKAAIAGAKTHLINDMEIEYFD